MRQREAARVARETVPGGGTPRVILLSAGLWQHTYRVERNGHAFSMRLGTAPARGARRAARYVSARDGAWVVRLLHLAADRCLAPPLVYCDARRGITVQKWAEGTTWPAASVRTARGIQRFALLLRQVHALPVPQPARISTPAGWVSKYAAALAATSCPEKRNAKSAAGRLEAAGCALTCGASSSLAAVAAAQLARLKALPPVPGVVCHSDLHRLNVLDYRRLRAKARSLLLLDWEYAHVSEPFWDLAGWGANNDFEDHLLRRLLTAYLGHLPNEAEWARCKLLSWLYDYVCLLWSELYLNSHRGGGASGVKRRAAVLWDRLSLDIGD